MKHRITATQNSSRMCFVCGVANGLGLKARFFHTESGELISVFRPAEGHQSYPGRLHGGVSAAILDETMGRAIMNTEGAQVWGVTIDLQMKYRKPVPLDRELTVIGRIDKRSSRFFEASGELMLDGEVAVSATGRYLIVPLEKITDGSFADDEWFTADPAVQPEHLEV